MALERGDRGVLADAQLDLLAPETPAPPPPPPTDTALHFLALASVAGVGHRTLTVLLDTFTPLASAWEASPDDLVEVFHRAGNRKAQSTARRLTARQGEALAAARRQLDQFARLRITLLFRNDPHYPQQLREADGPPFLFVQGPVTLLQRTSIAAVVGTREPTPGGLVLARRVTRVLADLGFIALSGLAEGIDAEVHTAALDFGGETVAVLGNGLNVDFPAANRDLRRRLVASGGALVTEYLPNESYSKQSFVQRNRIQAGLSGVVIPVEARRKGGTAHTIRFARELKRPLIGVRGADTPVANGDDVYALLAEAGGQVFDLDSEGSVAALRAALQPWATDARPSKEAPEAVWRRVYRTPLLALRDLLRRRDAGETERAWIIEAVRRILDERGR